MEPFIGQVMIWPAKFAPKGWAFCDGRILAIAEHPSLYAIIDTTYGGDGRQTFRLPDLRGRTVIGQGYGPGLTPYRVGVRGGREYDTLREQEMPYHSHLLSGDVDATVTGTITGNLAATVHPEFPMGSGAGNQPSSAGALLADGSTAMGGAAVNMYTPAAGTTQSLKGNDMVLDQDLTITQDLKVAMQPQMALGSTGGGQYIPLVQPYTAMYYVIAMEGLFPSRD